HGLPVFSKGEPMERTTPTGALLLRILADGFTQDVPPGKICASGFGLGNRTSQDMPNVLRVLLMDMGNEIINEYDGLVHEKLIKLECNIDDMNAQDFEPVTEKLFSAGALDVWTESIYMKKGRPAVKFCCLAKPDNVKEFIIIILKNTSSQGVRLIDVNRVRLNWRIEKFKSSLGEINIKFTFINDEVIRKVPEYEDLKRLAGLNNLSMFEVRNLINKEI
ncbi:MAG: LarC family nickel insertion protein, partial [Synergistaceae bacterium]|nr:LarC family nickel insertion protein [Synergistaceae bacterium]